MFPTLSRKSAYSGGITNVACGYFYSVIPRRVRHSVQPTAIQKYISLRNHGGSGVPKHRRYRNCNLIPSKSPGAPFSSKAQSPTTSQPHLPYGLYGLLSEEERNLLEEQKQLIEASQQLASKVESTARNTNESNNFPLSSQQLSSRNILEGLHLEATFSVVIAGEFNAGKSTLINALIGSELLEMGALPTTDSITVVRSAASSSDYNSDKDVNTGINSEASSSSSPPSSLLGVVVHSVENLPLLKDLTLIDTPGTNSAWLDHTERTKKMLPAADLILFVTSADRPFSESERSLLQSIQAYRKNIVVVINKMDILEASAATNSEGLQNANASVIEFVTDKASELLGARPVVLPVSGRLALETKLPKSKIRNEAERSKIWQQSNFGALETFLKETLTDRAKIRSKLLNPIGIAEGVMADCLKVLDHRKKELRDDVSTLAIVEDQFEGWKKQIQVDLEQSRSAMCSLLEQEGQRCEILLQRMKNPYDFYSWTLFDNDRLEEEWAVTGREVSMTHSYKHHKDIRTDLLEHVTETADLTTSRGKAQGQAVIEFLGKRPSIKDNQSSLVGSVTAFSRVEVTRKNLVEKLTKAINDILSVPESGGTSSKQWERIEKDRLFASLKQTALISCSLNAAAIGPGIMLALPSIDIDPSTGWIGIVSLLATGSTTLVIGKFRAQKEFETQWRRRADHLRKILHSIAAQEVDAVHRRIEDGVSPYTRFVTTEKDRIELFQEECEGLASAARNLRNRIQKMR